MSNSSHFSLFAQKEKERFKLKAGVFLILIQNNEILLLKRYRTGIEDGMYVVPMGGHDGKEPLTKTLIREAQEETNISLKPEDVELCHVMHRFHPMPHGLSFEQLDLYYRASSYQGVIKNMEPHKCDELRFYPLNNLPRNISPFILHALDCLNKGQFFSEYGWEN
jgi:8-oxo-dGTP pyrophosphatase MutT (NUDIX family)